MYSKIDTIEQKLYENKVTNYRFGKKTISNELCTNAKICQKIYNNVWFKESHHRVWKTCCLSPHGWCILQPSLFNLFEPA